MLEILAGDIAHKAHRHEDRDDGQADRDDGETDLVGRLHRRFIGGFAQAHVADDIFDFDDRVIDEDTGGERDREKAHEVQGKAEDAHHPKRRNDRQWQSDRGDGRRTKVAQEQEDDDHGERRAFEEGMQRGVVVSQRVADRRVDALEIEFWMFGFDLIDELLDARRDADIASALGAQNAEGDYRLAVPAREGARLGDRILDRAEIGETILAAVRQVDLDLGERRKAAGALPVHGALQTPVHLRGAQAEVLKAFRIERHLNFALHAANPLDRTDALDAFQLADNHVVDEIGQLLGRFAGGNRGISFNSQPYRVDAADLRRRSRLREIGALYGVFDGGERFRRIDVEIEDDRRGRYAVAHGRRNVTDSCDAGDRVFDLVRHLRFEFGGSGTELRDHNRDDRRVDVRQEGNRQFREAYGAERQHG